MYNLVSVILHPSVHGCYWTVRARRVDGHHSRDALLARGYSHDHLHLDRPEHVIDMLEVALTELRARYGPPAVAGPVPPSGGDGGVGETSPESSGMITG